MFKSFQKLFQIFNMNGVNLDIYDTFLNNPVVGYELIDFCKHYLQRYALSMLLFSSSILQSYWSKRIQ